MDDDGGTCGDGRGIALISC